MKKMTFFQFFLWRKSFAVVHSWFLIIFTLVVLFDLFFVWELVPETPWVALFLVGINVGNFVGTWVTFKRLRRKGSI